MLVREFWKIPFLRLLIPLILGIYISDNLAIEQNLPLVLVLICLLLIFIYKPIFDAKVSYHRRWIFGLIITFLLLNLGAYLTIRSKQYNKKLSASQLIFGIVNDVPKIKAKYIKAEIKVRKYQMENVWYQANEKIFVSFEPDSFSSKLEYGDLILISGGLQEIANAGNPSEFDYKKYLARKHVHYKTFQNSKKWELLAKDQGNPIFKLSYGLRNKLLNIYQKYGIKNEEFGLLAALTLGATDYLNDELIAAYSDSGAMHILSVSGLHVGIILFVLNFMLFFLGKSKFLRIVRGIVIISCIWFFALLSGLSPSVNRASAMITLFVLAGLSKRKPSPYNSITASAFILLLIEPLYIFDVGFQLSYLAVIALIFFYKRIYNLYEPKYWIVDKIWSLTVVSIAAQIGTTALSIFYFHQFPTYALISNLIAVPLSSGVMILAIGLLFTSFIPPLANGIAFLLNYSIIALNSVTKFIDGLPLATIEPISINSVETLFIHISLILIFIFIITKNSKIVISILAVIILTLSVRDYRYYVQKKEDTFTVYNVTRKSVFSVIKNGKLNLYADSAVYNDEKSINYLTSNILANDFVTNITTKKLEDPIIKNKKPVADLMFEHCFSMDSLKILYLNKDFSHFQSETKFRINYLIISKNATMDLSRICGLFQFEKLIADASVPKWKQEILKKDCQQMAIPFYNVSESGAFVHKIKN